MITKKTHGLGMAEEQSFSFCFMISLFPSAFTLFSPFLNCFHYPRGQIPPFRPRLRVAASCPEFKLTLIAISSSPMRRSLPRSRAIAARLSDPSDQLVRRPTAVLRQDRKFHAFHSSANFVQVKNGQRGFRPPKRQCINRLHRNDTSETIPEINCHCMVFCNCCTQISSRKEKESTERQIYDKVILNTIKQCFKMDW